jgi:simple sugar transport system permease protein
MDFSSIDPTIIVYNLMIAATPILYAALGELVTEKSGVLNLGVEGMMIIGAICGFSVSVETNSVYIGFMAAACGGALLSILFAVMTQYFLANQVASGLALTLFGLGLAALLGHSYTGQVPPQISKLDIPILANIPVLGKMLFAHDFFVYLSLILVFGVWYFLSRTRLGLIVKAVGENHESAHAIGYNVTRIRFFCIVFGGALAGLGGGYLSLIRVPQWTEGMTAGAGWIALAIVVFSTWRPWRLILGAYIFGGITILQLNLQAIGVNVDVALLSMTPYAVTIVVLVLMSLNRSKKSLGAPGSLGKSFIKVV